MLVPVVLLGLSICAVWLPAMPVGTWLRPIPPWTLLFIAAIVTGLLTRALEWTAVASLVPLGAIAWWSSKLEGGALKASATLAAIVLALALALHVVPGFQNPTVIDAARFSADSAPYTQRANFDKGAAGLLLLALMAPRLTGIRDAQRVVRPLAFSAAATVVVVVGTAAAVGYVRWDPKWPSVALTFLAINLLFTCVAEEAFFRGVIQEKLSRICDGSRALVWVPVAFSTALFAIAHVGGGWVYVALAGLAGLGYSLVYAFTRRIEAAVLTHFVVNLVHFVGFSYPHLAR